MTELLPLPQRAGCPCGISHFEILTKPFARFICHCRLCQAYTGRAFSDVTVLKASQVSLAQDNRVVFRKYRPPPNISRGSCTGCGKPVIEFGWLGAHLAFVPTPNISDPEIVPPPRMHIFYHRRLADARDDLPKYSGYFGASRLSFALSFAACPGPRFELVINLKAAKALGLDVR